MRYICLAILCIPVSVFGVVDTRSAGYSKTFVDYESKGSGLPLSIVRTYGSRSLFNGIFGFGWCSNLETRVSKLPDGSLKVVECGGGMEIAYHLKGQLPDIPLQVQCIMKGIKKKRVGLAGQSLKKLEKDLLQSSTLREDFLQALGDDKSDKACWHKEPKTGNKYYARGRVKEYIVVTSKSYIRYLPDGTKEYFNKQGRLVKISSRQSKIEIDWSHPQRIKMRDERGRQLTLYLNKSGKVKTAKLGKKRVVGSYQHQGEDLRKATNSYGETFEHRYDGFHNLKQNTYPDGKTEKLTYNVQKDWVTSFKDRNDCVETYGYGVNKNNPNHYFSTVEKKCGRRVTHTSKYEFWHKNSPNGGKYLHRAKTNVNGRLNTDVIYHPVFNTPVSFFKNGVRTKRKYYANGLLEEKDNVFQNVRYSEYNTNCRKPEKVAVRHKNPSAEGQRKFIRTETIKLNFNEKCELYQAKKSDDEWIKVRHNSKGQIVLMEDQSRKKITLTWHKTLNKPEIITREGVGSLKIVWDKRGSIAQLKSLNSGATVIAQVTSVFNSFLTTLRPVEEEMVIL